MATDFPTFDKKTMSFIDCKDDRYEIFRFKPCSYCGVRQCRTLIYMLNNKLACYCCWRWTKGKKKCLEPHCAQHLSSPALSEKEKKKYVDSAKKENDKKEKQKDEEKREV